MADPGRFERSAGQLLGRRLLSVLVAATLATLGVWLVSMVPVAAASAPSTSTPVCEYQSKHPTPATAVSLPERGPAKPSIRHTTCDVQLADARKALKQSRTVDNVPTKTKTNPNRTSANKADNHSCAGYRSFSGDTLVLMADGSYKPISKIKIGDWVIATDPETGKQVPKKVTRLWVHQDNLLDLIIDADLDGDGQLDRITTTEDHPFWNATDRQWQDIQDFDTGDDLITDQWRRIDVVGLDPGTTHTGLAYNLTVQGIHTYHVGEDGVLVHNCGPGGQIAYNSDELSVAAHNARVASGVSPGRNVAAARVEGLDDPIIGFSQGGGYHAERHILDQLEAREIDPSRVTGLYSDRQPCPVCGPMLSGSLRPGIPVTWAVPWGSNPAINAASNRLLRRFIGGAG